MSDLQPRQAGRTEGPRAVAMAAASGAAAATTTGWAAVEAEAGGAEGGAGEDAIDMSDSGVRIARGEGGEGVELGAAGRAASRERAQLQGALLQGAQLQAELQGALAEERRGAVALRGQAAALVAARDSARVETAAMRRAVRAAVSEGRRETASLKAEELRDEVTKLRYELELARVREGIDCRDAAATALAALRHQFEAYVTRADERLGGEGNFDQGRTSGSVHRSEVLSGGDGGGGGGGDGGGDGGSGGDGDSGAYLRVTPLEHPAVSVQPLPSWLPRTQRHLGALTVELMQGEGGPVCFGNTVTLRGRGGRYVDVEGGTVGARWSAAGAWQVRPLLLPHPIVPPLMLPPSTVLPRPLWQALRLERCGSEASYTSRAAPGDVDADVAARVGDAASRSVVCHGDILCVRAHTGRLLRLAADATEGGLPELSATAESHEDAQRWEVLLA